MEYLELDQYYKGIYFIYILFQNIQVIFNKIIIPHWRIQRGLLRWNKNKQQQQAFIVLYQPGVFGPHSVVLVRENCPHKVRNVKTHTAFMHVVRLCKSRCSTVTPQQVEMTLRHVDLSQSLMKTQHLVLFSESFCPIKTQPEPDGRLVFYL